MDKMEFMPNEIAILNEKANKGLPMRTGECVKVLRKITSPNYDYECEFNDGSINPVRECELNKLTEEDKQFMEYLYQGNKVLYWFDTVTIQKVDYLHKKAEIKFGDSSSLVVDFDKLNPTETKEIDSVEETKGKFTKLGLEIGEFTDDKNKQYGSSVDATYEMIQVLMKRYEHDNNHYLIPKSLLQHILLQVRMMDKQNRIFNNPSSEGDSESPYKDLCGYSLIGIDMVLNNEKR